MTGSFKSRLARGQRRDGRTFSPSSIQAATPVDAAHPTVRTRPRRLSLFSFRGFRCVLRRPLSSLPTTHPPLSKKRRNPLSFSSSSPPPFSPPRYIRARRTRSEGDKAASGAVLPPSFLAPDRRRSGPTARGGRRSRPGRRCFQYTEAVFSILQLAATDSSGFRRLSNNVLLLYLRLLLSYLPG